MMKMASRLLSKGHCGRRQIARWGRCDRGRRQEMEHGVRTSEHQNSEAGHAGALISSDEDLMLAAMVEEDDEVNEVDGGGVDR